VTDVQSTTTKGAGIVLMTLAAGQFLMTLDSSVMNVSIATVAKDVGTTVSGIQTAITLYTLVMAAFMITGGKIGELIGRRKAFAIGAVIYAVGSSITALAPSLAVLMIGWSVLEGLGAALIMPAIVALVASNFGSSERPRAYGIVASAAAIAVAAGPLIGGLFTTYASWRWVFAGEVLIVLVILALTRRIADAAGAEERAKLDGFGTVLSAVGLGLIVFGVLRAGVWGLLLPKGDTTAILGLSPVVWLILGGIAVMLLFVQWEARRIATGREPLIDPALLKVAQLRDGVVAFFFQYFVQAGMFFTIPLFLSVALGLSAIATGVRLLPLSLTLVAAAAGIPKLWPNASPRRIARLGFLALLVGLVLLIALLDVGSGPEVITVPLLLAGLGIGMLASQLGAVTVGAVGDEHSGEVGGLQNTVTNLGASLGTALAGAVLIGVLTTSFFSIATADPAVPDDLVTHAQVQLTDGVPFISDADLTAALDDAGVDPSVTSAVVDDNEQARIDGLRAALAIIALFDLLALLFARNLPTRPAASEAPVPL
jgi:MFS family permease